MNPVLYRLIEERKKWRQDTPKGYSAKPIQNADGTLNLFKWECKVPGARQSIREGKTYKFTIEFSQHALNKPLKIYCKSPIFHPNIDDDEDDDGHVCSTLTTFWPKCGLKQILYCLQSFLEDPNLDSAINYEAARLYKEIRKAYNEQVNKIEQDCVCLENSM